MLYVRKVLVVIKSGEKNKPMDQDGRGWWEERRKNPAKINHGDNSPTAPLGVEILKYCYENYEYNADINEFIEKVSTVQEETNILQETMEEEIDDTVSSLDEKDDEESEEQKEEERISYSCPPSNESNPSTYTLFNSPSCLPKDDCYDPLNPFLMMLAMLVAKMPI